MSRSDRVLKRLSSIYRKKFRQDFNLYVTSMRRSHPDPLPTKELAEETLRFAASGAWKAVEEEVCRQFGAWQNHFDPLEYVLYSECLKECAPAEWVFRYEGRPIPGNRHAPGYWKEEIGDWK